MVDDAQQGQSAGVPCHVAIIMDGNGRWAQSKHLPRVEGHRQGAKTVRMVVEESRRLGIRYLSLFAFSTENWQRPKEEVWALMKMFERYLSSELTLLQDNGIRLRVIGNRDRLSDGLRTAVERAEQTTLTNDGMDLVLAVSYGGREELVHAAKNIAVRVAAGELAPADVSAEDIRAGLFAPEVPDPDLLIRTSEEFRISNFLLWQLAYTEIVVTSTYWPAFGKEEYHACIREFGTRKRRYGLTGEQVVEQVLAS